MSVTGMQHVLVLAEDIEATRAFYCEVVGLQVGERPALEFPGYWLYAGSTPCLHIAERRPYLRHAAWIGLVTPHEPPGLVGAVDHIAFDANDYESATARIERHGVSAVHNQVPGGPRQLFVEDPNGVRVEINCKEPIAQAR
jgi:catechol 2,3-dioxygenase-like lactoylglutathione lyase family enzyme